MRGIKRNVNGKEECHMKKKNLALLTTLGTAGSLLAAIGVCVYLKKTKS